MKFAHKVKHNGVEYLAGQEVPIGIEPKKELQLEDMTPTELSKLLLEKYDINLPAQKGKKKLLEAIAEAEASLIDAKGDSNEDEEESDEDKPLDGQMTIDDIINEDDETPSDPEDSEFAKSVINDDNSEE